MSETNPITENPYGTGRYEIRLKGHLDDRWAGRIGDVTITLEDDGNTLLTCPVIDQAALHGLLKRVRDLGLSLLSVNFIHPSQARPQEAKL